MLSKSANTPESCLKTADKAFVRAEVALTEMTRAYEETQTALTQVEDQIAKLTKTRDLLEHRSTQLDGAIGKMVEALYPTGEPRQMNLDFDVVEDERHA